MIKNLLSQYNNKFVSKWLVLFGDLVIAIFCFIAAYLLRFEFEASSIDVSVFKYHLLLALTWKVICFLYYRTYQGIVRHTTVDDAYNIFKAVTTAAIFLLGIHIITENSLLMIPKGVIVGDAALNMLAMVILRFFVKEIHEELSSSISPVRNVAIYGSGEVGQSLRNALKSSKKERFNIVCFIDDNLGKIGKFSSGIKVVSRKDFFEKINPSFESIEVVLAVQNITPSAKADYANEFLEHGIILKSVPKITDLMDTDFSPSKIKEVNIEDLLNRQPIDLNNENIAAGLREKTILVTGAAGSIGSEIARQVLLYKPQRVIFVDHAESALYDLETELVRLNQSPDTLPEMHFEVQCITNYLEMKRIFERFRPSYVFHAAAYKHVPLMEKNPSKAIKTNVFGTKNLADLANLFHVQRFVMVSTDKAVNPTNVMGATKRLAEMYVQSLGHKVGNTTDFITTRFGNVLDSNGSVVPLFKKQIAAGGPLSVTHKDITRYFMTIPEACQLVLEAGTTGNGQEVYVFDMGSPVKIYDLAVKMIQLAGLQIDKDIKINITGLRPGEKLYEELLATEENTVRTYHKKIWIAKVKPVNFTSLAIELETLFELIDGNDVKLVSKLKELVPEYISNNSIFEELDKTTEIKEA
jgi:FlaA1/EpsC-like NDP-sugar epimerase